METAAAERIPGERAFSMLASWGSAPGALVIRVGTEAPTPIPTAIALMAATARILFRPVIFIFASPTIDNRCRSGPDRPRLPQNSSTMSVKSHDERFVNGPTAFSLRSRTAQDSEIGKFLAPQAGCGVLSATPIRSSLGFCPQKMVTKSPALNYYDILHVPRESDPSIIEAAFKSEVLKHRDLPGGGEQTRRINLAYRALSKPDRRRDYDAALDGVRPAALAATPADPPKAFIARGETSAAEHSAIDGEYPEPRRRRRGAAAIAIAVFALALIAFAALWAGRLTPADPKIASIDRPASAGNAPEGPAPAPGEPTTTIGSLADSLPDVFSLGNPPPAPDVPGGKPDAKAPPASDRGANVGSDKTDDNTPPVTSSPSTPSPTSTEPDLTEQATQSAEASPQAEAPTPTVRDEPIVNRSAPPRLRAGGLSDSDNQRGRFEGSVGVRLAVGANGRPQSCRVTRSSGNSELDSTTCRLLQDRLEFTPARDRSGNAVESEVESTHVWGRRRR